MSKDTSLYLTLGITSTASVNEITSAYRRQALIHHPDKRAIMGKTEDDDAVFQRIKYAYEILKDPASRALYDKYGQVALTLMQHTGSAETAAAILNPTRSIIAMLLVFIVLCTVASVPLLIQMRLDRWLRLSWWYALGPTFVVLGTLALLMTAALVGAFFIQPEVDTEGTPTESRFSPIIPIAAAWLAIVTIGIQVVVVASAVSSPVSLLSWWQVFLPWTTFEVLVLIFKFYKAVNIYRRPQPLPQLWLLFRWNALRVFFLAMLVLDLTFTWWFTVHLMMLPLYAALGLVANDLRSMPRYVLIPLFHPLLTILLLHLKLSSNAIRWFSVFCLTYLVLIIPIVLSLLAVPGIILWHRSFLRQGYTADGEGKLFEPGFAMGPWQQRIQ